MWIQLFKKYSQKSREKKVQKFFRLMDPAKNNILLDIGGNIGYRFREIWNYFERIIVVDLYKEAMKAVKREVRHAQTIIGDACNLPLDDESVDYVFSNAVIEHISRERRHLFASEIERVVRKGYFITTPNYYFPYEPHDKMPFWQYLPKKNKKMLSRYFTKGSYTRINLLSSKELKKLFPKAKVERLWITIWPATLVCYRKK